MSAVRQAYSPSTTNTLHASTLVFTLHKHRVPVQEVPRLLVAHLATRILVTWVARQTDSDVSMKQTLARSGRKVTVALDARLPTSFLKSAGAFDSHWPRETQPRFERRILDSYLSKPFLATIHGAPRKVLHRLCEAFRLDPNVNNRAEVAQRVLKVVGDRQPPIKLIASYALRTADEPCRDAVQAAIRAGIEPLLQMTAELYDLDIDARSFMISDADLLNWLPVHYRVTTSPDKREGGTGRPSALQTAPG